MELDMDITGLHKPISDEFPQGEDLRSGHWREEVYALKDLRNLLRNKERQALSVEDIYAGYPAWQPLFERSVFLLENVSKDLEVMAWVIESALRLDGFKGLSESLNQLEALLTLHWPNIFPKDEDGFESTLFPLTGLNGLSSEGALIMPLRMAHLFMGSPAISLLDCVKAFEVSETKDPQKKEALKQKGMLDYESVQAQVAELSYERRQGALSFIEQCVETFTRIEQFLYEHCGHESPPSSQIKGILQQAFDRASHLAALSDPLESLELPNDLIESRQENLEIASPLAAIKANHVSIRNRQDAFILIRKLIVFFKETEPHSPIAYNLERINRWGDLSLPELISELITDENARLNFKKITGVEDIN
ncbi:type VI secretion system protein TssA [Nitrincola tibetensis]|uniref:Type VI secretion system protein TssA n=2 Tax=Nitrincola tibetensis TaxID=2219697 RepID=A0A364NPV2_9GAMM|nr:type VI secretion system protein TssA [Nitrincola tibetensis]